ncbi:hypothetical protein BOX15_Mlig011930g3 [Macrostomum lignano]|uniref:Phosphatidylcholine transfer protein n=2 Tax=Macrostomum lignano TaxID=282301 RepID=A0A267GLD7_9PLAT|nr:hypothetical protein BOX15_Mlig011930g3 [Macrostomum lignano]
MFTARARQLCHACIVGFRQCLTHPQLVRLASVSGRALLTKACSSQLTERTLLRRLMDRFGPATRQRFRRNAGRLMLGSSLFAFDYGVTDEELQDCLRECAAVRGEMFATNSSTATNSSSAEANQQQQSTAKDSWSLLVRRDNITVWQKPHESVYEYRVCGRFSDISPAAFVEVMEDLDYRKQWDDLVLELQYLSRDRGTNTDLIRWVSYYPRPMRPREYIYKRRWRVDPQSGAVVFINRSVAEDFGQADARPGTVRVNDYRSDMVIWPHSGLRDNGFDYVLTYCDNPQSSVPSFAYNWVASSGLPDFMSKLHQATKLRRSQQVAGGSRPVSAESGGTFSQPIYS